MKNEKRPTLKEYLKTMSLSQKILLGVLMLYIIGRTSYFLYRWLF